jgi:hypothetical protein
MRRLLPLLGLLACGGDLPVDDRPDTPDDPTGPTLLDPAARAIRVSTALRGVRPSPAELDRVEADPAVLDVLVDDWLQDPRFGETIRHLHAETLLMRDPNLQLPALGPLEGATVVQIQRALAEEPLALAEHIVLNDRPYTELVTADYTVVTEENAAIFAGVRRAPGPGEQIATFTDGRPAAGILSTNGLWFRHVSNGENHHRARANTLTSALLCTDFLEGDIPITGEVDLSDPDAVGQALETQTECIACHQALDPVASHLFSVRSRLGFFQVRQSYTYGCGRGSLCYPVPMYDEGFGRAWRRAGMRPPGYFGLDSEDLGSLGAHIAQDDRFAACTVRRFVGYLTQTAPEDVPRETVAPLQTAFVDGGYDARDLVRRVVLSDAFLARPGEGATGLLATRPVQLAATIEDLTGFRWVFNVDSARCRQTGNNCTGDLDAAQDDLLGFRSMIGGIDGFRVTEPTHTTTPTKALFLAALAEEASRHVVLHDARAASPAERRLFDRVPPTATDEAGVREQLVSLHRRLYGEALDPQDPAITEAWTLFAAALGSRGVGDRAAVDAWTVTLAGLLQDPRLLIH